MSRYGDLYFYFLFFHVFFFNDTATTEIYTLSLHDALPIYEKLAPVAASVGEEAALRTSAAGAPAAETVQPETVVLTGRNRNIKIAVIVIMVSILVASAAGAGVYLGFLRNSDDNPGPTTISNTLTKSDDEPNPTSPTTTMRSEERRVGKECRSRWWADH